MTKGTWVYIYLISKERLPPEGARKKIILNYKSDLKKKVIYEILIRSGPKRYICEGRRAILNGISLLKVYEKQATTQ